MARCRESPCRPTCNVNPCQPMLTHVNQSRPMLTNVNQCQPMSTHVNQCHPDAERPTCKCNVKPPLHLRLNKWSIIFGRLFSERESGIQRLMFGHCCCIQLYTREKGPIFENCVECSGQLASKDQCGRAGRIVFLQLRCL